MLDTRQETLELLSCTFNYDYEKRLVDKMSFTGFTRQTTLVLRSSRARLDNFYYCLLAFIFLGGMTGFATYVMIRDRVWLILFVVIPFTPISLLFLWLTCSFFLDLFKPSVKIRICPKELRPGTKADISWSVPEPLESLSIYLAATETNMTTRKKTTLTHIDIASEDKWENIINGQSSFVIPVDSRPSLSSLGVVVEWILHVHGVKRDSYTKISDFFPIQIKPEKPRKWYQAIRDKLRVR
jgi:hypothetical protein